MKNDSQIIIYQTKDGRTKLQVKFEGETAWLSQAQMADLLKKPSKTSTVISETFLKRGNYRVVQL